jgi:hypothetical protein
MGLADPPAAGVIDLHHRGHRVVEGAVEPLEGQRSVRGGAAGLDAQPPLERGEQIEGARDPACHPDIDAHDATARLGEPQLEIVGGWPRL